MLSLSTAGSLFRPRRPAANAPVVCFTHSLNADGGMWVEQMVPLLGAGYRVLRLDMRGHGGSAPVDGDYTMDALAADVKGALDVLGIKKVHYIGLSIGGMIGQGFALAEPAAISPRSACATRSRRRRPARPAPGRSARPRCAARAWPHWPTRTMDRWFTGVQEGQSAALDRGPRHDQRHDARGLGRLHVGDPELRLSRAAVDHQGADDGDLRRRGRRHAARSQQADRLEDSRRPLRGDRQARGICPTSNGPNSSTGS